MRNITCCKNCNERYLGCHDKCEEYQRQKAKNDELRANMLRDIEAMRSTYSHQNNKNKLLKRG